MSAAALEQWARGNLCVGRQANAHNTPRGRDSCPRFDLKLGSRVKPKAEVVPKDILPNKTAEKAPPQRFNLDIKELKTPRSSRQVQEDNSLEDLFETQLDVSARGARSNPQGDGPLLSARSLVPGVKLSARGMRGSPGTPRVGAGTPRMGDLPSALCQGPDGRAHLDTLPGLPLSPRLSEHSSASESSSESLIEGNDHDDEEEDTATEDLTALRAALTQERQERLRLEEALRLREQEIESQRLEQESIEAREAELQRTVAILRSVGDRETEEVLCPTPLIGRMIGKKGVHLHDIQEACGAHRIFAETRQGPPRIIIIGYAEAAAKGKDLVEERLARLEGRIPLEPCTDKSAEDDGVEENEVIALSHRCESEASHSAPVEPAPAAPAPRFPSPPRPSPPGINAPSLQKLAADNSKKRHRSRKRKKSKERDGTTAQFPSQEITPSQLAPRQVLSSPDSACPLVMPPSLPACSSVLLPGVYPPPQPVGKVISPTSQGPHVVPPKQGFSTMPPQVPIQADTNISAKSNIIAPRVVPPFVSMTSQKGLSPHAEPFCPESLEHKTACLPKANSCGRNIAVPGGG